MKMLSKQEALYQTMHNACPNYRNINQGILRLKHWISGLDGQPASILEVGCGNGKLCKLLVDMGYDVTGLDIVSGPYDHEDYNFVKHDITLGYLPFKDNEFDYCVSFDVLEHLSPKWVGQAIWEMARVTFCDEIIGTVACFERFNLHQTVKEPEWWMEQISRCCIRKMGYQVFESAVGKTLLYFTKKKE